jgi:hypothetical protein
VDDDLQRAALRTRQYFNVDGLVALAFGCLFVIWALLTVLSNKIPSAINRVLNPASILLVPLFFIVIGAVKKRITYPRTGYLMPRDPPNSAKIRAFLLVLAVSAVGGLTAWFVLKSAPNGHPSDVDWILFGLSVFFALILVFIGQGLPRFYWLAGLSIIAGAVIVMLQIPDWNFRNGLFYSILGGGLLVSGGWTLWTYLRQNPRHQEAV